VAPHKCLNESVLFTKLTQSDSVVESVNSAKISRNNDKTIGKCKINVVVDNIAEIASEYDVLVISYDQTPTGERLCLEIMLKAGLGLMQEF